MAVSIDDRITNLNNRRKGLDRLGDLSFADRETVLAKSLTEEKWQKRQQGNKHTRYALGAMQPVGSEYTEITIDTAERVGKQLENRLAQITEFRLQGSVPLNVHIRGVSDVDLLVIDTCLFRYDPNGCLAHTYAPATRGRLDVLQELRRDCEAELKAAYPAVTVDCSGGKAVAMHGGSLPRPVDVVPSVWYNTADYQASSQEFDRGVVILDKHVPTDFENQPFLHIKKIDEADMVAGGGLKKAIRLVKNVKSDSDRAVVKKISSFDLASLMYHSNLNALSLGRFYELAVLAEVRRFLDWVYHHEVEARCLYTPDGSRVVLDTAEKFEAIRNMSYEIDELAKQIAKEQNLLVNDSEWNAMTKVLNETALPNP
ncbi:hypothetical protein ACRAQ7_11030 [Erythrobacter sp. W53]|uniref:hypothetical protein n=1 Tax=Erythrobacter sp. W53 TaxID=3425947 RepID=UPI003D769579